MQRKHLACVLLGGISALGLWACLEQPQGHCQVAQGQGNAHFAVYKALEKMPAACADKALTAERIGFETYQLPGRDSISIAWRPERLQAHFDAAREEGLYGPLEAQAESLTLNITADYSSKPDAQNRCYVFDNTTPATPLSFAHTKALPEVEEVFPATTYHYEWRNLVVYSLPASPGQVVEGELRYGIDDGSGLCEGTYSFVALWPAHFCTTNADCKPSIGGQPGAPINPGFADHLVCHAAGYCTLVGSAAEIIEQLAQ